MPRLSRTVRASLALVLALTCLASSAEAREAGRGCVWAKQRSQLEQIKAQSWRVGDDARRNRLALELADCLEAPDPVLRDGLAFSGLQAWMRSKQLSRGTLTALDQRLRRKLVARDPSGFGRPFAALVLAEIARADRIDPFLDPAGRRALVDLARTYLGSVTDYRAFDDRHGWRHGVAHGADLVLQLSLNPALGETELKGLRDAVTARIAPADHSYTFGEPERLSAPILLLARRRAFTKGDWDEWIAAVASPAPLKSWDEAFKSSRGLARLHDVRAFLKALYAGARLSRNVEDDILIEPLERALPTLP